MPTPREGETEAEFVERCIPEVIDDGTAEDGQQAAAVCHSMYDEGKKSTPDLWFEFDEKFWNEVKSKRAELEGLTVMRDVYEGGEGALIYNGGTVKALGGGKVGGYLVRFTSDDEPDLEGEYFDSRTWYGDTSTTPVYYSHGLDPHLGLRTLGTGALAQKDAGVWIEAQLELRDEYERAVYQLAKQGKLGWSSGTAPHLVEREEKEKAIHIRRWPLGLDASLTPTPADPGNRALSLKEWAGTFKGLEVGPQEAGDASVTTTAPEGVTVHVTVNQMPAEGAKMEGETMSEKVEEAPTMDWDAYNEHTEKMIEGKFAQLEDTITDKLTALLDSLAKSPSLKDAGYVSPDSEKDERAETKSFGDFLLAIRNGNVSRLHDVYGSVKAMGEQSGTTGGYLVPEEYVNQLMMVVQAAAVVRPLATVLPAGSNRGSVPALNHTTAPTAGKGYSAFAGGVRAYWTGEAGTMTSTEPSFEEIEYNINDLGGYTEVSNNLIADSATAIERLLNVLFGRAIAAKEDYAFLRGTGAGEPLGILASPCAHAVTTNADNTWAMIDALNMLAHFQPVSASNASISWVMHRGMIPDFYANFDVSQSGVDWVQPREGLPMGLLGYPIRFSEHMPAPNTDDVLLGDFAAYLIFDRECLQIDFSEHAAFTSRKGTWRFVERLDGQPWLSEVITLADPGGAYYVSPFCYHDD